MWSRCCSAVQGAHGSLPPTEMQKTNTKHSPGPLLRTRTGAVCCRLSLCVMEDAGFKGPGRDPFLSLVGPNRWERKGLSVSKGLRAATHSPDRCGSVGGTSSCKLKGCRFESHLGHMSRLWV